MCVFMFVFVCVSVYVRVYKLLIISAEDINITLNSRNAIHTKVNDSPAGVCI